MKQNLIFDETEQVFTMGFGEVHQVGSNITVDQNYTPESKNAQSGKAVAEALKPIHSSLEEKAGISYVDNKITDVNKGSEQVSNKVTSISYNATNAQYPSAKAVKDLYDENLVNINNMIGNKADKISIQDMSMSSWDIPLNGTKGCDFRFPEMTYLSFVFVNDEYPKDYMCGISFKSGATATALSYAGTGILNWVGTDCRVEDTKSIFTPVANKHYDIVIYSNGKQFIGLVNGYEPSYIHEGEIIGGLEEGEDSFFPSETTSNDE